GNIKSITILNTDIDTVDSSPLYYTVYDFTKDEFNDTVVIDTEEEDIDELGSELNPTIVSGFQGYKGGFDNIGKGTPEGDGKDKAMRNIADGFIGEIIDINGLTSTNTSYDILRKKSLKKYGSSYGIGNSKNDSSDYYSIATYQKNQKDIIMLARNKELANKPLNESTKLNIDVVNKSGGEFIVGDMPGVDSQFIDYLQKIGAKFTIYHTGDTPRIKIKQTEKQDKKSVVSPKIDTSREWKGDLKSRSVYTNEGINTMRTSAALLNEHFGNPFSEAGYGNTIKVDTIADAVIAYKDWLLGTKHNNVNPEQREWIINQINQGKLDGATLLYAGKSEARGQGMHPTALVEIFDILRNTIKEDTTKKEKPFSGLEGEQLKAAKR
ncbi:hypothetical protein EB077_14245, partial [bacterium]|nr:hypothetical protein [bacterium]